MVIPNPRTAQIRGIFIEDRRGSLLPHCEARQENADKSKHYLFFGNYDFSNGWPQSFSSLSTMNGPHEVCYGTLYDALAKPVGNKTILRDVASAWTSSTHASFALQYATETLHLFSEDGVKFAILDLQTTSTLQSLTEIAGVRFEAVVDIENIHKRTPKSKKPVSLTVNIFGPREAGDQVSLALSRANAFLQHPQALDSHIDYHNPDMLVFPGVEYVMREYVGVATASWKRDHLIKDIEQILGSLDQNITPKGNEACLSEGLISQLTKHQEIGARFVLQREDAHLSRQLSAQICNATGAQCCQQEDHQIALGGIIADAMGLGKTLTILTSILRSSEKAVDFAFSKPAIPSLQSGIIRLKATLVVVPSAQLLENWESEIQDHFSKDALRYKRFHGQNRPREFKSLQDYDIVLTTYATLAADHGGQGLMFRIEWYRVVLDEAHWIRNSSSKQFKAVAGLTSMRKWCLSGTPIQNKLDDLASLAAFLQIRPISSKDAFQKYIFAPLAESHPDSTPLRAYMEAYCLRRTEHSLSLPDSREHCIAVCLSTEERQVYDKILDESRRQMDELVSTGRNTRCTKLFTALLRLRIICNLGTFRMTSSGGLSGNSTALERKNGLTHQCERCSKVDEDTLVLLSSCEVCPDCLRPLHQRSPSPLPASNQGHENDSLESDSSLPYQQGFSTKLNAVVKNVGETSKAGNKTIVFSYWKTTLRVLARLLSFAGITYIQVDGETSYAERSSSLKAFKQDATAHVLLMTIETGAVGLNLTVASRIHIVEPQWNPSIEEQAVARALRMGQKSEVIIFRYVTQNTVEQNVVNLQKRKSGLAKFTFGSGSEDSISNTLQELETVLDSRPRKRSASEM